MSVKSLILLWAILFVFVQVHCVNDVHKNPGRVLNCWPEKLKYEQFNIDILHSSRRQSNKIIQIGSILGPNGIDFDPRRRTAVIVHGFVGYTHIDTMNEIAKHLLKWQDMNVLLVNWLAGAWNPLTYHQAVINSEYAAIHIKRLFAWLKEDWIATGHTMESWGSIHFIGYSLGAHVVGQAAEFLKVEDNLVIDRITALDPAEICLDEASNPLRLSKNNARFVDVIHTDGAVRKNEAFGILEPMGHADFYVNGGTSQPGCQEKKQTELAGGYVGEYMLKVVAHLLSNGFCKHGRSVEVFINSITHANSDCKFWGHPWRLGTSKAETQEILKHQCNNSTCPQLGINAENFNYDESQINTYYVATANREPYCTRH